MKWRSRKTPRRGFLVPRSLCISSLSSSLSLFPFNPKPLSHSVHISVLSFPLPIAFLCLLHFFTFPRQIIFTYSFLTTFLLLSLLYFKDYFLFIINSLLFYLLSVFYFYNFLVPFFFYRILLNFSF